MTHCTANPSLSSVICNAYHKKVCPSTVPRVHAPLRDAVESIFAAAADSPNKPALSTAEQQHARKKLSEWLSPLEGEKIRAAAVSVLRELMSNAAFHGLVNGVKNCGKVGVLHDSDATDMVVDPLPDSINISDYDKRTVLHTSAGSGDLAKLQHTIHGGVAADASDYTDRGALHVAAKEGHMSVSKGCLVEEAGVSVNVQDRCGTTAEEAVEILVEFCNYLNTLFGYSAHFLFLCVCVPVRGVVALFQNAFFVVSFLLLLFFFETVFFGFIMFVLFFFFF